MNFILVASGGALGSCLRYGISLLPVKGEFPFLTLIANFLGAVLIGFIASTLSAENKKMNLLFKTGFCGGFTTFSTFSLESFNLFKNGKIILGAGYIFLSLILCLLGVAAGYMIGQKISRAS